MSDGGAMVSEGQKAPGFSLPTGDGKTLSLGDMRGKRVVLYFYPKDDTPGCTKEACSFRDLRSEFAAKDAEIVGVSLDSPESHRQFSEKYSLPFPLVSDEQAETAKSYGVYVRKERDGKEFWGVDRTTFVVDREGVIRKVFPKVDVEGHSEQILAALDQIP
jgi:peroxiredoxin Q/BCP